MGEFGTVGVGEISAVISSVPFSSITVCVGIVVGVAEVIADSGLWERVKNIAATMVSKIRKITIINQGLLLIFSSVVGGVDSRF